MPATTYEFEERFDLYGGSFDKIRFGFSIFAVMLMHAAGLDDTHPVSTPATRSVSSVERPAPISYFNGFAQRLIEDGRSRATMVSGSTWVSAD
jgi:hypothetical protein